MRLIRLPEAIRVTGLSRSALYDAIRRGEFPGPVKIGARSSAWDSRAVEAWIEARIAAARRVAA